MTAAPAASAISIAGTEARMRVSSVIRPCVVERNVEVGADEHAAPGECALLRQRGERQNMHERT